MNNLHGCTHGWEDGHGCPMECPDCQIARLTRELDDTEMENGRHLALLIQQRFKTRRMADLANTWLKQRDEARAAARWLRGLTYTFEDENEAIKRYPWLDYHA